MEGRRGTGDVGGVGEGTEEGFPSPHQLPDRGRLDSASTYYELFIIYTHTDSYLYLFLVHKGNQWVMIALTSIM